jgi:hypothetical protein
MPPLAIERLRGTTGKLAVAAWAVALSVVSTFLLARHVLALPVPARPAVEETVRRLRAPDEQGRWLALHVLYAECACSQGSASDERVAALAAKGLRVTRLTPAELAALSIEAAPLLIVAGPDGRVRYAGGYSERKQGPEPRDVEIVRALRAGDETTSLPLFGCAVSEGLRRTLNPLAN